MTDEEPIACGYCGEPIEGEAEITPRGEAHEECANLGDGMDMGGEL